jgi:DNA-binding NarL/FixJ family response regulator
VSQGASPDRRTGDKEATPTRSDEDTMTTTLSGSTSAADRAFGGTRRDDLLDRLSPREQEVLALMAEGRSNRAIGEHLTVELKTVETHVSRVFTKLGLTEDRHENRRVLAVLTFVGRASTGPAIRRAACGLGRSACTCRTWTR